MPTNTTYNPPNMMSFVKTALNFDARGFSTIVTAGTTSHIDFTLTDDMLITGAWVVTNNGNYGDTASLQVIDTNGTFTGVPGTVLNTFMTNWYLPPQTSEQFDIAYPAKIFAGLTLRIIYTSTGSNNVFVAINYKLHRVLI